MSTGGAIQRDAIASARVELVVRDSRLDADNAVEALREVHAETPVDMVTGMPSSSSVLAVQQFAEAHDIITLHSGASSAFFSGEKCSPLAVQWEFNTYSLAHSVAAGLVDNGTRRWYFITADYSFGHDLTEQVSNVVTANGDETVGQSLVPYPATRDAMAAAVNEASAAEPSAIGLANADGDMQLAIRQLGVYVTARLRFATSFYWNRSHGQGVVPAFPGPPRHPPDLATGWRCPF